MNDPIDELPPKGGAQRAYCDDCRGSLDLVFSHFHKTESGIEIHMNGLPMLERPKCGFRTLPDQTRFSIMRAHEIATKEWVADVTCQRSQGEE